MKIAFSSEEELYHRLFPALRTKRREFRRMSIKIVKEEDIWEYLKNKKWKESVGLSLAIMVDDILNLNGTDILEFMINSDNEVI